LDDGHLYLASFYFIMTTITTVGFGDIAATNATEAICAIFIMIIGVLAFSFASGSLSSIMGNYD